MPFAHFPTPRFLHRKRRLARALQRASENEKRRQRDALCLNNMDSENLKSNTYISSVIIIIIIKQRYAEQQQTIEHNAHWFQVFWRTLLRTRNLSGHRAGEYIIKTPLFARGKGVCGAWRLSGAGSSNDGT